jgi:hypothetical protein
VTPHSCNLDCTGGAGGLARINLNRDLPRGSMGNWAQQPDPLRALSDTYAYPPLENGRITDTAQFAKAQRARQAMAQEIFNAWRTLNGLPDPNAAPPALLPILENLAQLAVNIVDYVDCDDYMTPFEWRTGQFVFGVELPRLVLNEVYAERVAATAPNTGNDVRFWIELHNPLFATAGLTGQSNAMPLSENSSARLWVPTAPTPYGPYKIVIVDETAITAPATFQVQGATGDPNPSTPNTVVKLELAKFTPDPAAPPNSVLVGDEINLVRPANGQPSGPNQGNQGYYLIGPNASFPAGAMPTPAVPKASMQVQATTLPSGQKSGLTYNRTDATNPTHAILLRRLACPAMPEQPNPAQPNYNPYVTVDYMTAVPTNDRTGAAPPPVTQAYSVGRAQPYAAHRDQRKDQKPATALMDQPQHTFFKANVQTIDPTTMREAMNNGAPARTPFDWLCFMDRPLVSPVELLQMPGGRPYELTQKFIDTDPMAMPPNNTIKFNHRADWFDQKNPANPLKLYRIFETLSARAPLQWSPVGGRLPGQVNINTLGDDQAFLALADAQPSNFFTQAQVQAIAAQVRKLRTAAASGVPGAGDAPFKSLADPTLQNTLFRAFDPATPTGPRLFAIQNPTPPHPYFELELFNKVFNNLTTRSNVFGVWLTVGFFEVQSSGALGAEINQAQNRHIRHRMFAIVDRTNLTIAFDKLPGRPSPQVGTVGDRPFFIPTLSAVVSDLPNKVTDPPGQKWVDVPYLSGAYDGVPWSIPKPGAGTPPTWLVVGSGDQQEVVLVEDTQPAAAMRPYPQILATFKYPHAVNSALSNALPGHPGPQPRFAARQPGHAGVVRYWSIIE